VKLWWYFVHLITYLVHPSATGYLDTTGQFSTLLSKQDHFSVITIDEAHIIFDWLLSYRPAFNEMKKLQKLSCLIIALSATLTASIAPARLLYTCRE